MRRKNLYVIIFLLISVAAGLLLVFEGKGRGFFGKPHLNIERIVLVTIDTLRADHLGCYGYPRDTSPFIDRLARESVLFTRAYASMGATVPSHASIFTSLYPIQHRVLKNGLKLNNSYVTMAEILKGRNYLTVGFASTNFQFKAGNIHQGFRVYNEPEKGKYGFTERRPLRHGSYRPADATIDAVIKWLSQDRLDDRFFMWVHLFDPHTPTHARKPFYKIYSQNANSKKNSFARFLINEHKVDFDFYNNNTNKMLYTINLYDAEISFVDTQLERLYGYMEEQGLNRDSLWIITSDHGEGLGNHSWYGHGRELYNEQIRVPLILHFPFHSFPGLTVDSIVEHVDLLPTVVELAGGAVPEQVQSIQGTSLVPLFMKDHREFPKKLAFSQRNIYVRHPPKVIIPTETHYEHGEKFSLQDQKYKYIYRTEGPDEFYALHEDPHELNNLAGRNSDQEKRLRAMLLHRIQQLNPANGVRPQQVDKEALERLKSLGYVQ